MNLQVNDQTGAGKTTVAILSLMLLLSACSSKDGGMKAASNPVAQSPTSTTTTNTTTTGTGVPATPDGTRGSSSGGSITWKNWTEGGQAVFEFDSVSVFDEYRGQPSSSDQTDFRINVFYRDTDFDGAYEGYVKIGYNDATTGTQIWKESKFSSGNNSDSRYNRWYNISGRPIFQSFNEDSLGALILVIDGRDDNNNLSGAVYFKNFNWSICDTVGFGQPGYCGTKPNVRSWFITGGPYEARDFLSNNQIQMGIWMYPQRYKRLGTFRGLSETMSIRTN